MRYFSRGRPPGLVFVPTLLKPQLSSEKGLERHVQQHHGRVHVKRLSFL